MEKNKREKRELKVAFCGTRGLPANYGGFETAVDEISKYFVRNGVKCEVFNRLSSSNIEINNYNGVDIKYVKGSSIGKLDTIVSSIQTGLHLIKHRKEYKYVLWFNNANFPGIILTKVSGIPMAVNTDGLEWRRSKWSWPFKVYYFLSTFLITLMIKNLISDSLSIEQYYKKHFKKETTFIPYGVNKSRKNGVSIEEKIKILNKYNLEDGKYFLQITRFEPENSPLKIAEGFIKSQLAEKGYKLVIIGYKKNMSKYADEVKETSKRDGVIILDAIYDKKILKTLRGSSFSYVHGNTVGGTNPALLEAMLECNRVLAVDTGFSREVLGNLGIYYNDENIDRKFMEILNEENQKKMLFERVTNFYKWDEVASCYLNCTEGINKRYPINPLEIHSSESKVEMNGGKFG